MEFFKGLHGLAERAELPIDETEVEDGLDAVGLDTDGLEVELLGAVELAALFDERVAEVHECARIVPVVPHGERRVLGRLRQVALEQVQEGQVVGRLGLQRRVLLLEALRTRTRARDGHKGRVRKRQANAVRPHSPNARARPRTLSSSIARSNCLPRRKQSAFAIWTSLAQCGWLTRSASMTQS